VALLSCSMLVQATHDAEIDSRGGQARSIPRSPASPLSSLI
jgi:hypothetical protein